LSDYATRYALTVAERRAIPIRENPAKTGLRRIYYPKKRKLDFAAARPVPELTRSLDIKLNERVWLRRCVTWLGCVTGRFPQRSGPRVAKLSGDHIPLGGFVR
jgi:hypothetical protein